MYQRHNKNRLQRKKQKKAPKNEYHIHFVSEKSVGFFDIIEARIIARLRLYESRASVLSYMQTLLLYFIFILFCAEFR